MRFTLFAILACLLIACANAPLTNQIEAASSVAADLAGQIDRLQHQGIISNEQEDKLLDRLAEANHILRGASTLAANCRDNCSNAESQLQLAQKLLADLQTELGKAQ